MLAEASAFLREVEPRTELELTGFVSRLRREQGEGAGEVTIIGDVDGRLRHVRVELQEKDYRIAHEAHGAEQSVTLAGTLQREGRIYWLRQPRARRIVSDLDLDEG